MVIIPVAENLFTDFSDVNMGLLNYLLSGPALITALSALLWGKLTSCIGKKKLLVVSFSVLGIYNGIMAGIGSILG